MNRMPGFNAHLALDHAGRGYAGRYAAAAASSSVIVPQDTIDDILSGGCKAACSAACVTAIAGGYKNWSDCLNKCAKDFGC